MPLGALMKKGNLNGMQTAMLNIQSVSMKLLDQYRAACKVRHLAPKTMAVYVQWIEQFVRFHYDRTGGWQHPSQMGEREVEAFLTHLAVNRRVAESTQNQAFSAILFLYRHVLRKNLDGVNALRAKRPKRLPTVLSREEVSRLFEAIPSDSFYRLMLELMYGTGLRVSECCKLRVCDVDFDHVMQHGACGVRSPLDGLNQ